MSKDQSLPTFLVSSQNQIDILIPSTNAQVINQGYSYNQTGLTYNQAGVMYGGLAQIDQDVIPLISIANTVNPQVLIGTTDAQVVNQGYTYNQAGLTYNQLGVMYGGLFNSKQDILPIISIASLTGPSVAGYGDIYTPGQKESVGQLMGILGLTYPNAGILE